MAVVYGRSDLRNGLYVYSMVVLWIERSEQDGQTKYHKHNPCNNFGRYSNHFDFIRRILWDFTSSK